MNNPFWNQFVEILKATLLLLVNTARFAAAVVGWVRPGGAVQSSLAPEGSPASQTHSTTQPLQSPPPNLVAGLPQIPMAMVVMVPNTSLEREQAALAKAPAAAVLDSAAHESPSPASAQTRPDPASPQEAPARRPQQRKTMGDRPEPRVSVQAATTQAAQPQDGPNRAGTSPKLTRRRSI